MGIQHNVFSAVTSAATGSATNLSGKARWLVVQSDNDVYYTLDGTTAVTSAVGMFSAGTTGGAGRLPVVIPMGTMPPTAIYYIATGACAFRVTELW